MKFTYIPVQEPDGSWRMVARLDENQRRAADKARRRILNIKEEPFDTPRIPFQGGDTMQVPFMYGSGLLGG